MASKKIINQILNAFGDNWDKDISEMTKEFWFDAFKYISDKALKEAAYKCMDELKFFPKVADIKKFMPDLKAEKHAQELRNRFTCPVCRKLVSALVEGQCWSCYGQGGGMRIKEHQVVLPTPNKAKHIFQENTKCTECQRIGLCIKEPPDSGIWQCRECYSGLSYEQYTEKLRGLTLYC